MSSQNAGAPENLDLSRFLRPALIFAVAFILLATANIGGGFFGELIAPAAEVGWHTRIAAALVLSLIIVANLEGLRYLPFRWQVGIVWGQLLFLALAFFNSFGLSYDFIWSRLPFLITQGAFTTIYISMAAIAISFVIALAGAPWPSCRKTVSATAFRRSISPSSAARRCCSRYI